MAETLFQTLLRYGTAALGNGVTGVIDQATTDKVNRIKEQDRQADAARKRAGQAPLTAVEQVRRTGRHLWQSVGQLPAGAASITVANSNRGKGETGASIGGYRPAIADAIPGTIGALGTLASLAGLNTKPTPGGYIDNSMQRLSVADQRTNDTLGIKAPQDAMETALNVAGSVALPGPEGLIGKIPTVARGVDAVTNAAPKLSKAAKVGYEIITPMRQTSVPHALAATVPAGVAIREGINSIAPDSDYNGALPTTQQAQEDTPFKPVTAAPSEDDNPFAAASIQDNPFAQANEHHEERKQSDWTTAAEVLGVAALGVAGVKYARKIANTAPFQPLNSIGHKIQKSGLSVDAKVGTKLLDSTIPWRTAANESLTPDAARRVNFRLDSVSSTATGAQTTHFFKTGEAPFASKKYMSPAAVVEKFSTDLSPQQQETVGNALLYASSLDDFNRTGVNASFSGITPVDKAKLVAYVKADPKLAPHFKAAQDSYKELMDYHVDTNIRGATEAAAFRAANPNYVHMSKDVSQDIGKSDLFATPFDAQTTATKAMARNIEEERAGVQDHARNPVHELPAQWAQAIRLGKINDIRLQSLDLLAASGAKNVDGIPLVRKLPVGEPPKASNIHTVFENGQPIHYQVNSPALDQSLKLHSRSAFKPLEAWRQLRQSFTTGAVASLTNAFQFAVSPFYETQLGAILRPKGSHQGLINEVLGRNFGKSIGPLDITQPLTAYTGAVRFAFDEMTRRFASQLTNSLTSPNTPLQKILSGNVADIASVAMGQRNATALRDALDQAYQTGIKAQLDRIGASSHVMRGSEDSLSLTSGLEDVAPNFVFQQGIDRFNQAIANKAYGQGLLAGIKVPWLAMRTSSFGEMVALAQESMRNGFAYSNLAANKGRINDMNELASVVRRASVDSSVHGSSPILNMATGSIEYSNLGLQTFYELGRKAKESPLTFGTNLMIALGSLAALKYASMTDPEVVDRNNKKTPEQQARTMSLPMGMEMPIEQSLRPIWATASTLFDHVSGASTGMYNPHFFDALGNWFDHPDDKASHEEMQDDLSRSLVAALKANNPATPENSGLAQLVLASQGLDPAMTEMSGNPVNEQTQTISGFDQDKTFVGSMLSAHHENLITTILGSFADHVIRTADEVYRANGHNSGPVDSMKIVADNWKDSMAQGTKAFKPMLFNQYENVRSIADANYDLVKRRDVGIKQVEDLFHKDVMAEAMQGSTIDPRFYDNAEDPIYQLDSQYLGTPLQTVGQYTMMLKRQTGDIDKQLQALAMEKQRVAGSTDVGIEGRNQKINAINEQRKTLYYQKLYATRQMEDQISTATGVPNFTFDGFDPKKFLEATQSKE